MRLWHKELIFVLPKAQLVAQWRELLAIKGSISKNGTPNHLLVNKVLNYHMEHFKRYTKLVYDELLIRQYKPSVLKYQEIMSWKSNCFSDYNPSVLYDGWHNSRYFFQCYHNLQEKKDCGGISDEEWSFIQRIYEKTKNEKQGGLYEKEK